MAITNNERIGKGLELLRQGIAPYVERNFKCLYESNALEEALRGLDDKKFPPKKEIAEWDVAPLLKLMWNTRFSVLKSTLGISLHPLVSELRECRKKWAHQESFTNDDTYRALDSMSRLLAAISAPQSDEVNKMKMEQLRLIIDEQVGAEKGNETESPNEIAELNGYDEHQAEPEEEMNRAKTEADARRRMKEDLLDKYKSEEEIAQLLHEIEKGELLRKQEIKELIRVFFETDDDKAQRRQHMVKKLDLEQKLAEEEIEQIGKTQLHIKLFELHAEKERLQLQHELAQVRIKFAAAKEFHNDERIKFETELDFVRQKKIQEYDDQERQLKLKIDEEKAKHGLAMEQILLQQKHELNIKKLPLRFASIGALLALLCAVVFISSLYIKPKEVVPTVNTPTIPSLSKPLEGTDQPGTSSKKHKHSNKFKPQGVGIFKAVPPQPPQQASVPGPVVTHVTASIKPKNILVDINKCLEIKGFEKLVDMHQVISYNGFYLVSGTARPNTSDKTDSQREDSARRKVISVARANLINWGKSSINSEKVTFDYEEKNKVIEKAEGIGSGYEIICSSYDEVAQIAQVVLKIPRK